jgi:hypothetical protein
MATKEAICPNGHTVYYMTGNYILGSVRCLWCRCDVEPQLNGQAVPLRWDAKAATR